MRQIKKLGWGWYIMLLFFVTGCAAPKNVIYFQDVQYGMQ